ncbi:hypothetical protein Tco_0981746 [Tanacetum coccineum]
MIGGLMYLTSMIGGLMYLTASRPDIAFATFVYHARCNDDCKSTSGGIQFLRDISWSSKKQDCIAMSTAKVEYVYLSAYCAQAIWMRTQLLDYGFRYNKIPMYCDLKRAIDISCNPIEYQLVDLFIKALPKERFEYLVHGIVIVIAQQQQQQQQQQQIIPADQLVFKFQSIGRFLEDSQQVETTTNPFVAPITMQFIQPFMQIVRYQGVVDKVSAFYKKFLAQPWQTMFKDFLNCVFQKKDVIQYPRFTKLIIADLMKKFNSIPLRLEEDYHFIKGDILLVSVYTTENVTVQGMLIPNDFITDDIRYTEEYKEYMKVFVRKKRKQVSRETSSPRKSLKVTIKQKKPSTTPLLHPRDDRERDEMAEATLLSLTLHKTTLATEAKENIAKVQEKLDEEEIEKMVEGEDDEELYASEFTDSMLNDDFDIRIEPGSHKEHPKNVVDDDDETGKEKKYDMKNDEKANDDENKDETSSMEIRKEKMQTRIPSPTRSPRKNLFSDKNIYEELTTIIREVLDHCNIVVPELTFAKTNEMLKEEIPRLVNLAVTRDREIAPTNLTELIAKEFTTHAPGIIAKLFQKHMQNTTLNLYPTTSSSTATTSTADIQHQLYLTTNLNIQDQVADPKLWEILKAKFEKL